MAIAQKWGERRAPAPVKSSKRLEVEKERWADHDFGEWQRGRGRKTRGACTKFNAEGPTKWKGGETVRAAGNHGRHN